MGMVIDPSTMTLATGLPEIMPKSALPKTAIFAAPPRNLPITIIERSVKNWPPPGAYNKADRRSAGRTFAGRHPPYLVWCGGVEESAGAPCHKTQPQGEKII